MNDSITISHKALMAILNSFIGGYPDPDNSLPPGPVDPIIRRTFDRVRYQLAPQPEPWLASLPNPSIQVALNPQPLPPRLAYTTVLAQEIINSITNLQDIADTLPEDAQARVGEVANRRLQVFLDEYCGTTPPKSPFPGPRPRNGVVQGFNSLELVVLGTQFEAAATTLMNEGLQQALSTAGTKLIEQGTAQL